MKKCVMFLLWLYLTMKTCAYIKGAVCNKLKWISVNWRVQRRGSCLKCSKFTKSILVRWLKSALDKILRLRYSKSVS